MKFKDRRGATRHRRTQLQENANTSSWLCVRESEQCHWDALAAGMEWNRYPAGTRHSSACWDRRNLHLACRRQGGQGFDKIEPDREAGRIFLLVTRNTKAWRNATQTNIANKLPIQFSYAENTAVHRYVPASTFHQPSFFIRLSIFLCFWQPVPSFFIVNSR